MRVRDVGFMGPLPGVRTMASPGVWRKAGWFASVVAGALASVPALAADDATIASRLANDRRDAAWERLVAGDDAKARQADGSTALHWAARSGDAEFVQALLKAGADARAENNFGYTPMAAAAERADARTIELLLEAGADVDSPNAEGQTALMVVARTGRIDAAEVLLRRGARVDAREQWGGQTALMWAAAQGNVDMVRLLLRHRADANARATVHEWARRVTAEGRPKDMNRGGFTALLYAAREDCRGCVRELLRGGADIDQPDPDGVTPLILALMNVRWDMAKLLIESGADVNLWDFYGQTPLYAAVDLNTLPVGKRIELPSEDRTTGVEVVKLLLDRGANPNAQLKLRIPHRQVAYDRYTEPMLDIGATPLLRAAKAGDIPVVKLLLAHGALPDLPNMNGDTPLMAAVGKGWISVPTRGANMTEDQALEVYDLLRAAGADVRARTNLNETALHNAALRGWHRVIRRLVEDGAEL
ncbi:MAG: ankyrin repeat domain-containing protein, partial [Lysobacteraceae bacterium]